MKLIAKVVLILLIAHIITDENIKVYLQKCTSSCNQKYCNVSTVCRPINRTSKFSSMDVYFHPGVIIEAPIYMEIMTYKKFTTIYRPFMIKFKEEICQTLLLRQHIFFKMIGELDITIFGNMFDPCPLSGHRYLKPKVTNVNLYKPIPLIPIGEWRLDLTISKNINGSKEVVLSWSDYYEIKPTGIIEF